MLELIRHSFSASTPTPTPPYPDWVYEVYNKMVEETGIEDMSTDTLDTILKYGKNLSNINMPTAFDGTGKDIKDYILGNYVYPQVREAASNLVIGLFQTTVEILSPVVLLGSKVIIVYSILSYYVSKDKKNISRGMWAFLVFMLFNAFRMVVNGL